MSVGSKKILPVRTAALRLVPCHGWILAGLVALSTAGCLHTGEAPPAASYAPTPRPAVVAIGPPLPASPAAPSEPEVAALALEKAVERDEAGTVESSTASDMPAEAETRNAATVTVVAETPELDGRPEESSADQVPRSVETVSVGSKEVVSKEPDPEVPPTSLIGVGRGDLLGRLGTPALLRREPPAEFWQFSGDGCVLHVYLYESAAGADYQVTHVELLPRGGIDAVPLGCFERLFLDHRRQGG